MNRSHKQQPNSIIVFTAQIKDFINCGSFGEREISTNSAAAPSSGASTNGCNVETVGQTHR